MTAISIIYRYIFSIIIYSSVKSPEHINDVNGALLQTVENRNANESKNLCHSDLSAVINSQEAQTNIVHSSSI